MSKHTFALLLLGVATTLPAYAQPDPLVVATSQHQTPEQERQSFTVPDGFEVQLVAAEPDIAKPINMAFDARGRLWVTSTTDYPFPANDLKGRDTVKILSDFGPDGRARKIETFADGLNIPIGILPYKDGAIIFSIPNLWMLRDTDGDGKCDKRDVLYSGFGHRDTHGLVNGLFYGFDGWIYACHGYANDSKVKGKDGHEISMNSGNVFRFKPDGSRVELFAKGQVNPFGSCMDKWGNLYTACCHSKPITLVLRGGVYESFSKPHDGLGFAPAMVHKYKGSTALCGLAWYEADYFPKEYQERFYLGDVVFNSINSFTVTWLGATPTAHQQGDFLKSKDPWFRPCDIKLGPDGALYVADFYNRIIGHYEVPLTHPGRDRTSGRIWRIVRKDKAPVLMSDRTKATTDELVKELASTNISARLLATHQLVERGRDAIPETERSLGQSPTAVALSHICWVMHRLGAIQSYNFPVFGLRPRPDETLVKHQLRIIGDRGRLTLADLMIRTPGERQSIRRLLDMIADGYAPATLSREMIETDGQLGGGLANCTRTLLSQIDIKSDPFLRHVARMALRDCLNRDGLPAHDAPRELWDQFADVALGAHSENGGELLRKYAKAFDVKLTNEQIQHCAKHVAWDNRKLNEFSQSIDRDNLDAQKSAAIGLAAGYGERNQPMLPLAAQWCDEVVTKLLGSPDPSIVQRGVEVALALRKPELQEKLAALVGDKQQSAPKRGVCVAAIVTTHTPLVIRCMNSADEPSQLREQSAKALGTLNKPEARAALVAALATAPTKLAAAIATALVTTRAGAEQLCEAIGKGQASPRLLTDRNIAERMKDCGLTEVAAKLTAGLPPLDKQIEALVAQRRKGFATAEKNVELGKQMFTKHCAICHQVAGQGSKIGPQLDGIGVRGLDRLLEDTLDPNRNVDPTFRQTTLQLADGRSLMGLVLREVDKNVVLADGQGKEQNVPKEQIEQRNTSTLSAMPANVAEVMKEEEFYHLLAFMLSLTASTAR